MGVLQRCLARGHWRSGSLQTLAAAPCLRLPGARLYGSVKPDGVQRRLVGDVIQRFEKRGFKLVGLKLLQVWEGYNVVKTSRAMVGETNPAEAKPGTVRGDFSVHTAQREISLWFRSNELISWDCCDHKVMYEP
ncbi:hypothetical protein E2320_012042 [Naja naja]|nr:hypothetical protein E2320_012042 [Naja naja]